MLTYCSFPFAFILSTLVLLQNWRVYSRYSCWTRDADPSYSICQEKTPCYSYRLLECTSYVLIPASIFLYKNKSSRLQRFTFLEINEKYTVFGIKPIFNTHFIRIRWKLIVNISISALRCLDFKKRVFPCEERPGEWVCKDYFCRKSTKSLPEKNIGLSFYYFK